MSDTQLSTRLKEETKIAHQSLEKKVIQQLKSIRSEADYADFLKRFYLYFNAVENVLTPYLNTDILPDQNERRDSSYLKADVEELGFEAASSTEVLVPEINSLPQALGALYVMEGSIMGGPIIVQMLKKYGVTKGFSFFSGYGAETGKMWATFTAVLNEQVNNTDDQQKAINAANDTFMNFQRVFN